MVIVACALAVMLVGDTEPCEIREPLPAPCQLREEIKGGGVDVVLAVGIARVEVAGVFPTAVHAHRPGKGLEPVFIDSFTDERGGLSVYIIYIRRSLVVVVAVFRLDISAHHIGSKCLAGSYLSEEVEVEHRAHAATLLALRGGIRLLSYFRNHLLGEGAGLIAERARQRGLKEPCCGVGDAIFQFRYMCELTAPVLRGLSLNMVKASVLQQVVGILHLPQPLIIMILFS